MRLAAIPLALAGGLVAPAQETTPTTSEQPSSRTPFLPAEVDNPVNLIRASNSLTRAGEEDAIRCLRWDRTMTPESPVVRDWQSRFRAEGMWATGQVSFHPGSAIALTVYVSRGGEVAPRFMPLDWVDVDRFLPIAESFPVVIVEDIPFFLWSLAFTEFDNPHPRRGGGAMLVPEVDQTLAWARRTGDFRSRPLRPPDNPFPPVEEVATRVPKAMLASGLFRVETAARFRAELYAQTIAMVHHVLEMEPETQRLPHLNGPPSLGRWQRTWSAYRIAAVEQGLHWDEATEQYRTR